MILEDIKKFFLESKKEPKQENKKTKIDKSHKTNENILFRCCHNKCRWHDR